MATEGRETNIPFTRRAETHPRRTDDVGSIKQLLEELPGTARSLHPDVRGILSAKDFEAKPAECGSYFFCILHIVVDSGPHLLLAIWRIDSLSCPLRHITGAIELSGLAAIPKRVQRYAFPCEGGSGKVLRYDGVAAAYTREARSLGIV